MKPSFKKSLSAAVIAATAVSSAAGSASVLAAPVNAVQVSVLASEDNLQYASNPRWIGANRVIVTVEGEEGAADYILDLSTKQLDPIAEGAIDLAVSPDGTKAAFTNDKLEIVVVDLASKSTEIASTDTDTKVELQYSKDGTKLIYIGGEKQDYIAELDLATKETKKIVNDKVQNKAELQISSTGKQLLYSVTNPGKVTADSTNVDADNVEINMAGTEPQIYYVNLDVSSNPVQLTSSKTNKAYARFVANDRIVYLSSRVDDEDAPSVLMEADSKKNVRTFFNTYDVLAAEAVNGDVYVLTYGRLNSTEIYKIGADFKPVRLLSTFKDVTGMAVSASGEIAVSVATDDGEYVAIVKDRKIVK
ncbi:TolB family protein [Paenibacillus thermotolerans]|uniref:TolB family protein n=1 Tax=Paenibacillus thermotolerans TaxID=3027807 RepID=UPI0023681C65|nr:MULTISPECIES: hypothetical protein [unclassified Paenibacillus]